MADCFGAAGWSQVKTFEWRDRRSHELLTLQRDA